MQALDAFTEHWRDLPSFLVDYSGNSTFLANVEYRAGHMQHRHSTVVRIRKQEHGVEQIVLQDAPGLLAGFPQLLFAPPRHAYDYDQDSHALLVRGHSSLLGGDFQVAILPA